MKTLFALLAALAVLSGAAVEGAKQAAPAKFIVKIQVFVNGKITADGKEVAPDALTQLLDVAKEKQGVVWYYRENGRGEPPRQAAEVFKMIIERRLPVSLSSKPDFSDYIDAQGNSKPRAK